MVSKEIGGHPYHSQIVVPHFDEVLDSLVGGLVFSVLDPFSGLTQLTIRPDYE